MYKVLTQSLPPEQPIKGKRHKSKEKAALRQIFCQFSCAAAHYFLESLQKRMNESNVYDFLHCNFIPKYLRNIGIKIS